MGTPFEELQKQAKALNAKDKATLARILIEELDGSVDGDAEQLWIEEAERRYDAFVSGKLEARSGQEVMSRARRRLK